MRKFPKLGLILTIVFMLRPINAGELDFMTESETMPFRTSVAITDTIEYINVEVGETLKAENGKTWKAKESGPIFLIGCTATELCDYILLRHKDVPVSRNLLSPINMILNGQTISSDTMPINFIVMKAGGRTINPKIMSLEKPRITMDPDGTITFSDFILYVPFATSCLTIIEGVMLKVRGKMIF